MPEKKLPAIGSQVLYRQFSMELERKGKRVRRRQAGHGLKRQMQDAAGVFAIPSTVPQKDGSLPGFKKVARIHPITKDELPPLPCVVIGHSKDKKTVSLQRLDGRRIDGVEIGTGLGCCK